MNTIRRTHRCLAIPEIVLMVCRELADDQGTRRRDLRSVALTCRGWFGPGVEYLWQDLGYFEPILASLPADLWADESEDEREDDDKDGDESEEREPRKRKLRRQLKAEDLLRFKLYYARHIKALLVCRESVPSLHFLQSLKSLTDADKSPLLPRLRTLDWIRYPYDIDPGAYFPFLVCFVNEKLKTLVCGCPPSSKEVQTTLLLLNKRCPSLTSLEVTEREPDDSTRALSLNTISLMAEQLGNSLRKVDLSHITHEQLKRLSTLPHLDTLLVTSLGSLGKNPDESDGPKQPAPSPTGKSERDSSAVPFPSLRDLTITTQDLYHHSMLPFLRYLSPSGQTLKRIFLSSEGCAPTSHWKQIVDLIICHCPRLALESIYFGENDDAGFAPSGFMRQRWEDREPFPLSPLFVFKNLKDFGSFVFYASPVTKGDLKELVSAWKHLTKLDISFPDSDNVYDKFTIDCHDMLFVVRSLPRLQSLRITLNVNRRPTEEADPDSVPKTSVSDIHILNSYIRSVLGFVTFFTTYIKPVPTLSVPYVFTDEEEHQNDKWMEAIDQVNRVRDGKPLQLDSDSGWETESETDSVAASDDGYCADLDTLFERSL